MVITILLLVLVILAVVTLLKAVRIIPQARAGIVERLGKYQATLNPGLHVLVPFIDRLLPLIDLREQVVSFPSQSVITEDNLVVGIDTVVYFQVTDPRAATYEITNYIHAVDELTSATLRNVVGGLNLEETLTSRDKINAELRGVLDNTTGRWGLRVSRVDIKEITPPPSIQDSMEKQMRAERDRRAAILTAEGQKQSQILTAEGERQAAVLSAEGDAKAAILRADGEAQAIQKVFDSIHRAKPTQKLLAYQYIQTLPKVAEGSANKVWMIPAELGDALRGVGEFLGKPDQGRDWGDVMAEEDQAEDEARAAAKAEGGIVRSETVKVTDEDLKPSTALRDPDAFTVPEPETIDPNAPVDLDAPLPGTDSGAQRQSPFTDEHQQSYGIVPGQHNDGSAGQR
ncbi:SPFH/Band 7/PHB domain protein [Kocuria sp. JC486]|uniref:SPFH/Band 7/PHB domain protein n=1 Tax=Kocuria soli TaxID=2485125 RepID=A0A3N3ZR38_9MICC|nr:MULTISPECIES: SPFH domain-containing protein [Kocuria]NHU84302.1 SPFH/Band 7/PHB domain protein [Kocuria sp. JC486]ROZ63725.1 SPFH/Band 7/PHB domain protein [Kocuria soli]